MYNGNANLTGAGEVVEFTKEQLREFTHCARDPIHFIEKYIRIVNIDRGLIPFELYPFQKELIAAALEGRYTICKLARQSGKLLRDDELIPTPGGFVRMDQLEVGSQVFDQYGAPCNVTFVSEQQFVNMFRITFDDGSTVDCCEDHQWTVHNRHLEAAHRVETKTAKQLFESTWHTKNSEGRFDYSYYIPNTKPVQYAKKNVLIDPYHMGVLLGDESGRDEGARHIPTHYLLGDVNSRIALLQGLMDTCGSIEENGTCHLQFTKDCHPLADDIYTLLCSLGLKVTRLKHSQTSSERLSFVGCRGDFDVCRQPHKLANQKQTLAHDDCARSRVIQNIEPLPDKAYGRCIEVDSPDHLYLCTKSHIPTHNTQTMAALLLWMALFNENYSIAILANKQAQAFEILDRITSAYEYLPKWLQQGVVEWNKGRVEFANGSKILASATSSSAIRGTSQNCITGDSVVTLQYAGVEFDISIGDLVCNANKVEITNNEFHVPRQQIYEVVSRHHAELLHTRIDCRGAPHHSPMLGWNKRSNKSRTIINQGPSIGTPIVDQNAPGRCTSQDEVCILADVERAPGSDVEQDIGGVCSPVVRLEAHRCNTAENFNEQQGSNPLGSKQKEAILSDEGTTTTSYRRVEQSYFRCAQRQEEDKRTLRQDQQEPREDQKNSREAPWNEAIGRSSTQDERSRQGQSPLEQRTEKSEVRILTADGFKRFGGIKIVTDRPTLELTTHDGKHISCTPDHKINTPSGWVAAGDLGVGHVINSINGTSSIASSTPAKTNTVYDVLDVEDVHSFYANGIDVSNCIYLDEFAFIPSSLQESFFNSVYPTISSGQTSKVIITSTPNGLNMFYKLWADSEQGKNEYKRVEANWWDVPGRDEAWKEATIRATSAEQFKQEFESCAGETLIYTDRGPISIGELYNEFQQHNQKTA